MDCNGTTFWSEYYDKEDSSVYYDYPTYRPIRRSPIVKSLASSILELEEWETIHGRKFKNDIQDI